MKIPVRAKITLAIIAGVAVGTGMTVAGALIALLPNNGQTDSVVTIGAGGITLMTASICAFIAHLFGGFRDIKDED